jgi:hypothetical protein
MMNYQANNVYKWNIKKIFSNSLFPEVKFEIIFKVLNSWGSASRRISLVRWNWSIVRLSLVQDGTVAGKSGGDTSIDYPTYNEVPAGLSFSCSDKLPGYYADPAAHCQVSPLLPVITSTRAGQLWQLTVNLFVVYLMTMLIAQIIRSRMTGWLVKSEEQRMWQEAEVQSVTVTLVLWLTWKHHQNMQVTEVILYKELAMISIMKK